jgi:CheY-like chemotaxis protein
MEHLNIMIVEDEALIAMNTRMLLEHFDHTVIGVAKNGPSALEILERQTLPDLAVVDIKLKGDMDGIRTATLMKERFDLPFIFITGNTDPKTIKEALNAAPLGILQKPFDEEDLESALEAAISQMKKGR